MQTYNSKTRTTLIITTMCFIFFINKIIAQDCPLPDATKILNKNYVSANIMLGGDLFWDRDEIRPRYLVPNTTTPTPSSIFNLGLWVGAKDDQNNLRLAAVSYPSEDKMDFVAGPTSGDCDSSSKSIFF